MTVQRITGRSTVWKHKSGAFRMDELTVEPGPNGEPMKWASFERGEAVAALIVNVVTETVILVAQFRPPVAAETLEGPGHRLVETAAGIIRQNESPDQCLQREIEEETGYQLAFDPATGHLAGTEKICTFYSSPGGSSERVHLYYVAVGHGTKNRATTGVEEDGEDILLEYQPLAEFFDKIDRMEFHDPKIIIAGQWLKNRWPNRRTATTQQSRENLFRLKSSTPDGRAASHRPSQAIPERIIGYKAGDIGNVTDVDIWVNSSNTEFLMDSIYLRTLSARIRALGAEIAEGRIVDDTIQQAVSRRLGVGTTAKVGTVLDTTAGALSDSHNVRKLLHVASVGGVVTPKGVEQNANLDTVEMCVTRLLEKCDELNQVSLPIVRAWRRPYRSVLIPLFGGGNLRHDPRLTTRNICERLIPAAIQYFETHPASLLERIYFLAFTPAEIEICDSVMSQQPQLQRLRDDSDGVSAGADAGQNSPAAS